MSIDYGITTANAGYQLYGPGSHAYAVEDGGGFHSTSYAYENPYGATYERNTFEGTFFDGVTQYRAGTYYSSGAGADRYASSRVYTHDSYGPPEVGGYGSYEPYGYADAGGKTEQASYTTRFASYSGGTEQLTTTTQSSTDYVNGANESTYSSLTETLSGGQAIPGSYSHYTLSSYTAYGSYYGAYTSNDVTR